MPGIRDILERIRTGNVDQFKRGTHDATGVRLVYINPDHLQNADMQKNIDRLRHDLEKQYPGITGKPGDDNYVTDEDAKELIEASRTKGPFAMRAEFSGQPVGIVNTIVKDFKHKTDLISALTGIPESNLKTVPGPSYMWDRAVGEHEGTHVNQPDIDPNLPADEQARLGVQNEAQSDQKALAYFRQHKREDMAQAFIDYRVLAAPNDPDHATSLALVAGGPANVTPAQMQAAKIFKPEMDQGVAKSLGITPAAAADLLENNPRKYLDAVDALKAKNEIGSTPETRQYIDQYTDAYRRQVKGAEKIPDKIIGAEMTAPATTASAAAPASTTTSLSQYYRVSSTYDYGGAPVAGNPGITAAVRGDAVPGSTSALTGAWNGARAADAVAVPGLTPPAPAPQIYAQRPLPTAGQPAL